MFTKFHVLKVKHVGFMQEIAICAFNALRARAIRVHSSRIQGMLSQSCGYATSSLADIR